MSIPEARYGRVNGKLLNKYANMHTFFGRVTHPLTSQENDNLLSDDKLKSKYNLFIGMIENFYDLK